MPLNNNDNCGRGQSPWRLGVVSFLNARPLICGFETEPSVRMTFDVPSGLTRRLLADDFDAALIPAIDFLQHTDTLHIVSDACIGCDGETLTVRVFSKVPPHEVTCIRVDPDSHTSVALARLIWPALFHRQVLFEALCESTDPAAAETVLLIGDKVVSVDMDLFRYQIDLGGAWKTWTGLPFVFAVWAARKDREDGTLADLLRTARDLGVKKAGQLAVEYGPAHGWSAALAQQYLQRYLKFGLTDKHVEGMMRFFDLATDAGLIATYPQLQASA